MLSSDSQSYATQSAQATQLEPIPVPFVSCACPLPAGGSSISTLYLEHVSDVPHGNHGNRGKALSDVIEALQAAFQGPAAAANDAEIGDDEDKQTRLQPEVHRVPCGPQCGSPRSPQHGHRSPHGAEATCAGFGQYLGCRVDVDDSKSAAPCAALHTTDGQECEATNFEVHCWRCMPAFPDGAVHAKIAREQCSKHLPVVLKPPNSRLRLLSGIQIYSVQMLFE